MYGVPPISVINEIETIEQNSKLTIVWDIRNEYNWIENQSRDIWLYHLKLQHSHKIEIHCTPQQTW